jgi:predicted permease
MGMLWQDIRYGVRMLRKYRGFTAVAVLTLALGIGANIAVFSLINALLLRSLPGVKDPHRLVLVTDKGNSSLPYVLYERLHDRSQSFSGLFGVEGPHKRKMTIVAQHAAAAESVQAEVVSGNYFDVLGVPAALGRTLTANDDLRGRPQAVVVLSYNFWQRRFGLDPAVLGTTIMLDDTPFTIVGVGAREFSGLTVETRPDVWCPFWMMHQVSGPEALESLMDPTSQWMRVGGRLKAGEAPAQVRSEVDVIVKQLFEEQVDRFASSEEDRQSFLDHQIELVCGGTGYSNIRREFQKALLLLMTTAGLVLLIACTNLAGLLLARGTARQREFNLRAALGAGRLTLIRQLGTESLLLAGGGGILGLLLAQCGVRLLASYIPGYGTTVHLTLTPDLRVLMFTFAVSAFTGMLFGLIPAWYSTRLDVAAALKEQSGAVQGRESGRRWSQALVVSQIALSCCLLIGAGLFVRTLHKLMTLDVGLNRENLLVFDLDLGKDYDAARWVNLRRELLQRLEGLPEAVSATFSNIQSLGGSEGRSGLPTKVAAPGAGSSAETGLDIRGTAVGPRYFETMGIPLRRGRTFTAPDEELAAQAGQTEAATRAVILDETSAHRLFGDGDPVGRLLQPIGMQRTGKPWPLMEVIGVARDVMHKRVRWGPRISLYAVDPRRDPEGLTFFYLRTLGDPLRAAAGIRQIVWELDPKVEVSGLQTASSLMDKQLLRERTICQVAGFFSLSALALACLGLYGIVSYSVTRRTREIGVRMALGAQRYDVLAAVVRQGMILTLIGCTLGVILAVALTRMVASLLYGVAPMDPLTFALTVLLLNAVACAACYLPARRAARIDPMVALRCE